MRCAEYLPLISKFLDGEASPAERVELEKHLAACVRCRATHDHWRSQGMVLRGFFARNALDESFVGKVRTAVEAAPRRAPARARIFVPRWAQAIAAIVVVGFLVARFFPALEPPGLAKVISAGEGLHVLPYKAGTWVPAANGVFLKAGDWIVNAERSLAKILLLDTATVTLGEGAVAQVGGQDGSGAQLTVMQGTVSTREVSGPVVMRTAAAAVEAAGATFDVHVENVVVPKIVVSDDDSETLTGEALSIAGVKVGSGKVTVRNAAESRDVMAGETAYFAPAQFAVVSHRSTAPRVAASLVPELGALDRTGQLSTTLVTNGDGLHVQVRADNLPLGKLLESATGQQVSGAGNMRVTGDLRYSVDSTDEAIVEAIGNQLGIPMRVAEQESTLKTASIAEQKLRLLPELSSQPEFSVRKARDGRVSFVFKGVSAGQVFRALRSVRIELPQLSPEDEWIPVSLQASGLSPDEVSSWIEQQLGLVTGEIGTGVRVVQVGVQTNLVSAMEMPGGNAVQSPAATSAPVDQPPTEEAPARTAQTATRSRNLASSGWWTVPYPPTDSGVPSIVTLPGISPAGTTGTATGKITGQDRHTGSRHLVWPTLPSDDSSAVYVVSNPWPARSVETIWNGYDAAGQLIAVQQVVVEPSSTLSLSPARDLPACGENGHWETFSDHEIYSHADGASAVRAVEAENLPDKWEFDLTQLAPAERLWFANPSESNVRVVLAVMRDDELVGSEQIILGPHMALAWMADPQAAGTVLLANITGGSLAAGVLSADGPGWQRGRGGEWVH